MAVSARTGKLYVSSRDNDEVICVDLAAGSILWRRHFGKSVDSMTLTPDGKRLYVSFRDESGWRVAESAGGAELSRIEPGTKQPAAAAPTVYG